MWKCNDKIGFDDRLVMLFAIPVLSFIIPFVFLGCRVDREPFFSWDKYVTTLTITSVLWIGDRFIMIWCRRRYPMFQDVQRRLIVQSVIMFLYTVIRNNLLGYQTGLGIVGIFEKRKLMRIANYSRSLQCPAPIKPNPM